MAGSKSLLNVPVARRQFLKASSVAAIGFAATGLIRPDSLFGAAITVPLHGAVIADDKRDNATLRVTGATGRWYLRAFIDAGYRDRQNGYTLDVALR